MSEIHYIDDTGRARKFIVKRDRFQPDKLYLCSPPFAVITPDTAIELANLLADVIEGEA